MLCTVLFKDIQSEGFFYKYIHNQLNGSEVLYETWTYEQRN